MIFKRKKNRKGFTLIELMIAVSISIVVILVSYSLLDSSIKLTEKSKSVTKAQNDIRRTSDWLKKDLSSVEKFEDNTGEEDVIYLINNNIKYTKEYKGKLNNRKIYNIIRETEKDGKIPLLESVVFDENGFIIEYDETKNKSKINIKIIDKFNRDKNTEFVVSNRLVNVVSPMAEVVLTPIAEPNSSQVTTGTQIRLSTDTEGAFIYYTIDGTDPTLESTKYSDTNKIIINTATSVRAKAFKPGMIVSEIANFDYIITDIIKDYGYLMTLDIGNSPSGGVVVNPHENYKPYFYDTDYQSGFDVIVENLPQTSGTKNDFKITIFGYIFTYTYDEVASNNGKIKLLFLENIDLFDKDIKIFNYSDYHINIGYFAKNNKEKKVEIPGGKEYIYTNGRWKQNKNK